MVYEYIPNKDPKRMSGIMIILISAAVGFFIFPSIYPDMPMRWVFQLSGVACLCAAIFITARYIGKSYIYRVISNDEGGLDLTVTEIGNGGRSRITVCRFALDNIEEAYLLSPADGDRKKALEGRARKEKRKRFDYCLDLSASAVCYLFVTECGEPLFIKIEADQKLFSYFSEDVDKRSGQ